ncbi:hypothetical protein WA026_021871 [Henosepilachna vigintioctopunctata]|uniref:Uncharacterized protein n=1 Tax=Henosepilachna vigintioctopunctata TaxID=420089 RepID=A0AAW1USL7_9CUCU
MREDHVLSLASDWDISKSENDIEDLPSEQKNINGAERQMNTVEYFSVAAIGEVFSLDIAGAQTNNVANDTNDLDVANSK